ncbi:MAG: nucleotide sugar dehydrogenase [Gemmatimonadota bacterium]|nr:nucleotide sugar dehydrogenase [Gemmatimonadota bacterium]
MTTNDTSDQNLRVAVFGLGYVGTVSAACLADLGHSVIGVDKISSKVEALNAGESPLVEPGLDERIRRARAAGRLSATVDASEAVAGTDMALICVGTPSVPSGDHDLSFLRRVAEEIGSSLRDRGAYYGVVVRSTGLPGTAETVVAPAVERSSGLRCGFDFGVASNPEFMREGTGVEDFLSPPFSIVGTRDERMLQMLRAVYRGVDAPFLAVEPRVAEILKLACNAFHAVKIVFANEIGTLCQQGGADSHAVMSAFVRDTKLNISEKYLRPGFAFGGSCLPKDLRALSWLGRQGNLDVPLLDAVLRSNELHIRRALEAVERDGRKRVGMLGLVFKPGTDDLRESPMVELAQTLLGRGHELHIFDPYLNLARLSGANKRFIDSQIPHLARLLASSAEDAVDGSEVVVVGYDAPEFGPALERLDGSHRLVDLAGLKTRPTAAQYEGISW